jgi:hypothetical protein
MKRNKNKNIAGYIHIESDYKYNPSIR